MGLFNTVMVNTKSLIKRDGKQHVFQFSLKDKGKSSSTASADIDIFAMQEVDKILDNITSTGAEILDMQCVGVGQSVKYIIRYK